MWYDATLRVKQTQISLRWLHTRFSVQVSQNYFPWSDGLVEASVSVCGVLLHGGGGGGGYFFIQLNPSHFPEVGGETI